MAEMVLILAAVCALGIPDRAAQEKSKDKVALDKNLSVPIYVFASEVPAAEPDAQQTNADRAEAVKDMREALRHKAGLAIVDERTEADVLVEVVDREARESPEGGFGGVSVTSLGDKIIRLHVVSGDEDVDIKGIGAGSWGRAAKDAADRVLKWIARLEQKKKRLGPTPDLYYGV